MASDEPRKELMNALSNLSLQEDTADLKVICGDDTYHAHKFLLCLQSEFFRLALRKGAFPWKEQNEGIITIEAAPTNAFDQNADDPVAIKWMMHYFYHLDYLETERPTVISQSHLIVHTKMYALGEKYGIPGLKALALVRFEESANIHWRGAEFAEAIPVIYTSTIEQDRGLRDAVVRKTISERTSLLRKVEIETVMKDINQFAYDIVKEAMRCHYV
ncbi:hypothetical protein M8818_003903 [Zalaria obscura]|uniref:Uncharacterized protein n=1 Tax=Zalaria obscura TaxID=2024903 RepID=A0ACC3SDP1_9PEZI